MIEIGKKFVWGYQNARQAVRNQRKKALSLAAQTEDQARALEQEYRANTAYLFRTSAEKMRQASQTALAGLAQRQARRAANGVSAMSASAVEDKQQARLGEQLEHRAVQTNLQTQGATQTRTFAQKWQAFWQAAHAARKAAKRGDRFSSLGRALVSLFQ